MGYLDQLLDRTLESAPKVRPRVRTVYEPPVPSLRLAWETDSAAEETARTSLPSPRPSRAPAAPLTPPQPKTTFPEQTEGKRPPPFGRRTDGMTAPCLPATDLPEPGGPAAAVPPDLPPTPKEPGGGEQPKAMPVPSAVEKSLNAGRGLDWPSRTPQRSLFPRTGEAGPASERIGERLRDPPPPIGTAGSRTHPSVAREERVSAAESGPTVRVHIGRVEVRAVTTPPAPVTSGPRAPSKPHLTLEAYMKERNGGGR